MRIQTPFPSHLELINHIAVALGCKKAIKNKLNSTTGLDVLGLKHLLSEVLLNTKINNSLAQSTSTEATKLAFEIVLEYFGDYTDLVREECADGLTREELTDLLAEHFLPEFWKELLFQFAISASIPGATVKRICQPDTSALQLVSRWIDNETAKDIDWLEHCRATLAYDDGQSELYKYHLREYDNHAEQSLPDQTTINRLFPIPGLSEQSQARFRMALTLARIIDYAKRNEKMKTSIALASSGKAFGDTTPAFKGFRDALWKKRQGKQLIHTELKQLYAKLKDTLSLDTKKTTRCQEDTRNLLKKAEAAHKRASSKEHPFANHTHFFWGRYHVLSGDLESAVKAYSQAFDQALYREGAITQMIILEGYRVAARHNAKGTDALLRKFKKSATLLLIDGTANVDHPGLTNISDELVEQWEKELWSAEFDGLFPTEALFPGTKYQPHEVEPWFLKENQPADKPINARNPNAEPKTGKGITKQTPKLISCVEKKDADGFKKLLQNRADVSAQDSYGKTALIMSLINLNPAVAGDAPNAQVKLFFDTLVHYKHTPKALTAHCQFSCDTALSAAIATGQMVHVEAILRMASESVEPHQTQIFLNELVNQTGIFTLRDTEPNTPLRYTLELIGGLTQIHTLPPVQQATTRRYDLVQLRAIASLLLKHGAQAEDDQSPLFYTPSYWLAIQLDEADILAQMLEHGASPTAAFHDLNQAKSYSSQDYAQHYGARQCLALLQG